MYKIYLITAITILFLNHSFSVSGQTETQGKRKSSTVEMVEKPAFKMKLPRNASISNKFTSDLTKEFLLDDIDTLNYPLDGTEALYVSDGGYVCGNNEYGDKAKTNHFEIEQDCQLTGILIDFAVATGGNTDIEIAVWDETGAGVSPGSIIGSSTIPLTTIIGNVNNQQMTYVAFDQPVLITDAFFAGVILPTATGDTLALWSNTDGDTNPGIAWEQWNDNQWNPMSSMSTWGLNLAQAIFPIVNYGELPFLADFSATPTALQVGQSVSFTDLSTGNPISWEWTFEGGTPATSTEQNPVITYNEIGSFDVTLTVSNDTASDSKTKPGFITVGNTIETDTLNFPLPGTYAVYVTDLNGFVTGNNEFGDLAKANFYDYDQNAYIIGILLEFAYATGGNPNIEIAVWDNGGTSGSPGSKIGSSNVTLNTIKDNITGQFLTYVPFNPPISIDDPFYAGFMLPTTTGDTLVVWSNENNQTNPGIAWELWEDNTWYPFNDPNSWGLNIAMAIFPIVQNSLSIDDIAHNNFISIYPNPSEGIFNLTTEEKFGNQTKIIVFNSTGIMVYKSTVAQLNDGQINLKKEPPGIYYVRITDGRKVYNSKIIKY